MIKKILSTPELGGPIAILISFLTASVLFGIDSQHTSVWMKIVFAICMLIITGGLCILFNSRSKE
jgi:UDP-N-acetylmuramyl pentapeptide phosphotransferase/UDP-N-acetylglucosamine-1-phosphate transferase